MTVSIEELRLEGFFPFGRHALAAALGDEFSRLVAARGVPPGLVAGRSPALAPLDPTGVGAAEIGRRVAAALYEGWS